MPAELMLFPRTTAASWIVLILFLPAAGSAQDVRTIDLATVSTVDGLRRVYGSTGHGAFGVPVAGGADCDGDGNEDYAMAAIRAAPFGRSGAGEVYLVFGDGTVAGSVDTARMQPDVLKIAGDGILEVAGAEIWLDDVTGDGVGDLLIGRQNHRPDPGRPGAGALSIVVGGPALREHAGLLEYLDLRDPPEAITILTFVGAQALGRLGIWMRTGDVTGDGIADIVVGADQEDGDGENDRGAAYLIRGGGHLAIDTRVDLATFGTTVLAGHLAKLTPPPGAGEFHFGATCQIVDLDLNGRAEVLVAATVERGGASIPARDAPPGSAHAIGGSVDGTLFVAWDDVFPATSWPAGFVVQASAETGAWTIIHGGTLNRRFGEEMIAADYDGDGCPDLFVGDLTGDGSAAQDRPAAGLAHVLYAIADFKGLEFGMDAPPASLAIATFVGAWPVDLAGDTAVSEDFDGDGRTDLVFSAPHGDPEGRRDAGLLYMLHGQDRRWPPSIDLRMLPPASEARITLVYGARGAQSGDAGDTLGYSAAIGDVDADGRPEIVTNEMLGNGVDPSRTDVGNLVILSGGLFAEEGSVGDAGTVREDFRRAQ